MFRLLTCCLVLAFFVGCGGGSSSKYTPNTNLAKEAVTVALDAWKRGTPTDPAGKLASGAVVIAVDMDWAAGQKLEGYEFGAEIPPPAEGPQKVAVKLGLAGGKSVDATYFVVGIDPVRVFRDKDYEKNFNQ